jgi:hypothetical protein
MWNYQNKSLPETVKFVADIFLGISLWKLLGPEKRKRQESREN